jgi:hypothetical protein
MKPWMSQAEIRMIERYLAPNYTALEYGSGGSTVHFSKLVREYYSIEHNRDWYERTKKHLSTTTDRKVKKYILSEVKEYPPGSNNQIPVLWPDLEKTERFKLFDQYIKEPGNFGVKFDACLIDGRARPECAKYIYDHMAEGSYIFIHDYWPRGYYHVVEEKYRVVDFVKEGQSLVVLQK